MDIFCSVEAWRDSLEKHVGRTDVRKIFPLPLFHCNNLPEHFIAAYAAA